MTLPRRVCKLEPDSKLRSPLFLITLLLSCVPYASSLRSRPWDSVPGISPSPLDNTSPGVFAGLERDDCAWKLAQGYDCLRPGVTESIELTRAERWADVHAHCAWGEIIQKWQAEVQYERIPFTMFVSQLLNGPEGMNCGVIGKESGCSGDSMLCRETVESGAASFMIINSFRNIYNVSQKSDRCRHDANGNWLMIADCRSRV